MTTVVIDTSCLISFVTDRNPSQQAEVARILEDAANLRLAAIVVSNVVTEFVHVLQTVYGRDPVYIAGLIRDLLDTPGIEFREAYPLADILEIWPDTVRDFGDAVLAAAAPKLKAAVVTFDRDFTRELEALQIPLALS